jgi:hypothetical protein
MASQSIDHFTASDSIRRTSSNEFKCRHKPGLPIGAPEIRLRS